MQPHRSNALRYASPPPLNLKSLKLIAVHSRVCGVSGYTALKLARGGSEATSLRAAREPVLSGCIRAPPYGFTFIRTALPVCRKARAWVAHVLKMTQRLSESRGRGVAITAAQHFPLELGRVARLHAYT